MGRDNNVTHRRFWDKMKDIEYVREHSGYRLLWGFLLFLKEFACWILIVFAAGYIRAELQATFEIIW